MLFAIAAANRDPAYWNDPDRLRPDARAAGHRHLRVRSEVLPGSPSRAVARCSPRSTSCSSACPGCGSSTTRDPSRSGASSGTPMRSTSRGPRDAGTVSVEPDEFRGRIGRDWRDSEPWWPDPERAPAERAERRARRARRRRLRAARLLRLRHRHADVRPARRRRAALHELPHHRAVLADARVPPDRSQPPLGRHGPHHRPRTRLPRLHGTHPEVVRLPVRDAARARLRDVRGRQVAPHARRRDAPRRGARPLAARARLRALLRLLRRRDAPVRARARARQPLRRGAGRLRRRLPPHRGPRRPRDRATSPTCARSTPRSRSSSTSAPARATRRTRCRPEWIERYRGRFDQGWDRGARRRSRASSTTGIIPPGTELSPRPDWVPAWDALVRRRSAASRRASWSASPAYLSHADAQIGRVVVVPRGARRARQHARSSSSATTARAARAARTGSINDLRTLERHPAGHARDGEPHRRARRPDDAQQLPVGLDDGRQHAVPPLEARGARGRRRRPVHRALAVAHRRARRDPPPVRPRDRRRADDPRRRRRRRRRRRSTASRSGRSRARASRRRSPTRTRADARHAVLRDARLARDLPRRLEGGDLQAARSAVLRPTTTPTCRSTTTCGSCTTSPRTSRSATTSRPQEPERLRELDRPLVGRGRAQPRAARSTTAPASRSWSRPRPGSRRARGSSTDRTARGYRRTSRST